jgi:S1-C subfamily serine protease
MNCLTAFRSSLSRALVLGSMLGLGGCVSDGGTELESRTINVASEEGVATPAGGGRAIDALVRQTGPSYVTLSVTEVTGGSDTGGGGKDSFKRGVTAGSGFVVDGSGYVLTAAHVAVKAGNTVSVRAANGRVYSGRVIDIRPDNDMALIKLKSFSGKAVTPAATACVSKGEGVFSLGKPEEQGDTARLGHVEAERFGRPVSYGKYGYPDAMVLRMDTKRGESGGPLFNRNGELAGMVVSTLADGNGRPLNLAHALPLSQIAPFLCANMSCPPRWQQLAGPDGACAS